MILHSGNDETKPQSYTVYMALRASRQLSIDAAVGLLCR